MSEVNHSERAHALLSASSASRWINCTPSPRLEEQFENKESIYAQEGTFAHEMAELILRGADVSEGEALQERIIESNFDAAEMYAHVMKYVDYCQERVNVARRETNTEPIVLIEQRFSLNEWVPEGFGTSDYSIVSDGMLEVIDLKFGRGVRVHADDNAQLKLYALGALKATQLLYEDVERVRMTIVQPRLDHISSVEISAQELIQWGETVVKPQAQKAFLGEGEFSPGSHCAFCKAKSKCKALGDLAIKTAFEDFDNLQVKDKALLTDEELLQIYKAADLISSFLKGVDSYILEEALKGKKWDGYKLVESRTLRKICNAQELKEKLAQEGIVESAYLKPADLKDLGELEKALGKQGFRTLVEPFLIKPAGAPTLAPLSDKRPEWRDPENDFNDINDLID